MSNFLKITMGEMCRTKAGVMAFVALASTAAFIGYGLGNEIGRILNGEKTKTESVFDSAKDELNTYQEIKKEGIIANSYAEAKQKLDSIKEDRFFRKYGIEPPAENASSAEKIIKQLELQRKLLEDASGSLHQLHLVNETAK